MPVSKSLSKLQQGLKSKKLTVHPDGRKFKQLNKATLREQKIQNKKKAHHERKSNELARIKFIQEFITSEEIKDRTEFTHAETVTMIKEFINRDDQELNDLISKRRAGRPPTSRQQLLEAKKNSELQELKTGFLCPDLTLAENVEFLKKWNGSFGSVTNMKLIRLNGDGVVVEGGKS